MAGFVQHTQRCLIRTGVCLLIVFALTGCSVFQSDSHFVEQEQVVSPYALASAGDVFVAEPFSLVAADSVGLATFGFEIAQWADMPPADALAQN